jgi:ribosomal protein S18 acetylase RimI-like enzyme
MPLSVLASRLFTESYGPTHPEPTLGAYLAESFSVTRLDGELRDPHVRILLVEDEESRPFGYAYLRDSDGSAPAVAPEGRSMEIVRFYVDARFHGRGVAQALMAGCEAEAARRGADSLWLAVWQEAPRAIAFYGRSGFRIVGTATFRFGDRLDDDFVMVKTLR